MTTPHVITQLRTNLKDVEDPAQLIQDDVYLALWLNIKKLDVQKAEAAIRDALGWWKIKNVPALAQVPLPQAIENKFPMFLDGVSKDGLPVAYVRLTSVDLNWLLSNFKPAEIVRYIMQQAIIGQRVVLEKNRLRYERLGDEALKTAWGHVVVVDAYGFTRKHLPSMKAINVFIQATREVINFPSTARIAYVIGVNRLVIMLLKPITPILNALGIILKVYGADESSWEKDVSELIDRKTLEEFRNWGSKFENED